MIFKDLKAKLIFLFSLITYLIAGLSTLICVRVLPEILGLILGFGFMIVALILHLIAKHNHPLLFIGSCFINAVATGLSIGAYYATKEIFLSVLTVVLLFLPYAIITYLTCLLITNCKKKRTGGNILGLTFFVLAALCVGFWKQSTFFSYGFFVLIVAVFYFILALKTLKTPRNILSDLSFTSFGFYLLVAYVVIVILSEGDLGDLITDWFDSKKKKKK